jgi:hypothetical protein
MLQLSSLSMSMFADGAPNLRYALSQEPERVHGLQL